MLLSNPSLKKMLMFTGAALLASVTAFAQMQQQQQPGEPSGSQNNPGTAGGGSVGPGMAPGMSNNNNAANAIQSMDDKAFVQAALQSGMAEVQLGQLAAQKASSDDVKQFGQKMVDDHTKLNDMMLQVARQIGVKPPTKLPKKDIALQTKLQGLSGKQFDDAYIQAMMKDHKKDENAFKLEAEQAQTPSVKQVARQGEPVIASHLQMIEQIAQAHNLQNGKKSSGM